MPLIVSSSGKSSGGDPTMRANPGYANAVCYGVWDIGVHESKWGDEVKRKHEVIIGFEIDQIINNPKSEYHGKRKVVSIRLNTSLYKSKLLNHLNSWFGKPLTKEQIKAGIDLEALIGKPAMLNLIPNGEWVNIGNIMTKMPSEPAMKPELATTPPPWVQKIQNESLEPIAGLENKSGSFDPSAMNQSSEYEIPTPDEDYGIAMSQEDDIDGLPF